MATKIKIIRIPEYDWDVLRNYGKDGLDHLRKINDFEPIIFLGKPDGVLWTFEVNQKNKENLFLGLRSLQYEATRLYSIERFSDFFAFDALCSKLLRCLL